MSETRLEIVEEGKPLLCGIRVPFADAEDAEDGDADANDDSEPVASVTVLTNGSTPASTSSTIATIARSADGADTPSAAAVSEEELSIDSEPVCARNLRRNSISMPSGINALELEALRLLHQVATQATLSEESTSVGTPNSHSVPDNIDDASPHNANDKSNGITATTLRYEDEQQRNSEHQRDHKQPPAMEITNDAITPTTAEEDSDEDEFGRARKPMHRGRFRSRRRASIAPLPALRLNSKEMLASDFDQHSVASNQASITSINSVASLLREKMQAFPQMIRKKKRETKDYKIKIFVIMMFFSIIFLIGYAYVAYHTHVLTRSYFDKIKFNSKDRIFSILNQDDRVMISGHLGLTLGFDTAPYHCLEEQRRDDGSVCIEWNGLARLHMTFQNLNVFRCYTLQWQALGAGVYPTDCYALPKSSGGGGGGGASNHGLWFGGGMTKGIDWSLSEANFDYAPFGSGDMNVHQFGNGVKRYFINSVGVAVQVSDGTPLHVSLNGTENRFCMRAMHDNFTFVNHLVELPQLEYKICTTEDMRSLHTLMTQQSLWDGLKESDIRLLHSLLEEPVWRIPHQEERDSLNEATIYNYSEAVIALGFMRSWGHMLVNEFWQENIGDFTVQQQRFATLNETIDVLHRRGFKVVFTIQPFISTDSPNFRDAVRNKLLIYERYSERSIPALTRYKSSASAGVLDITKNASVPWLLEKLEALRQQYKVDGFYLDLGTGYNLPHYYQCRQTLLNPDTYLRKFTARLEGMGVIGVTSASVVPKPPAFLSAPPVNATWEGMREMLTSVLLYGVLGYPFVLPGPVGGDYALNRTATKMLSFHSLGQPSLPDPELYIRWLQLATFMPAMQYGHLPSAYGSELIMTVAKELNDVREKIVVPLLKKYLSDSMNEGLPLVRPLWMLDPRDAACLSASDEFSIGEELIVAPILNEAQEEREVYLPQGVWKDGIDGSLRKGSRWMHSYKVPKDKIAYFIKMPDNTRF